MASLKNKAYLYLREKIARGELEPGSKLSNRALARQIGVSFIPVREAINQLVTEGVITEQPGIGFFVAKHTPEDIIEIYEIREALESYAACKAMESLSAEELSIMESQIKIMISLLNKKKRSTNKTWSPEEAEIIMKADGLFHYTLLNAADNRRIMKIFGDFRLTTRHIRRKHFLGSFGVIQRGIEGHQQILQAIKQKNKAKIRELIARHMQSGCQSILKAYENAAEQERKRRCIFLYLEGKK